jgi:Fe-S-cluster containining protein
MDIMDIEDLYAMIPQMECPAGCTECCSNFGVPSRTRVEDERFKAYLKSRGREITQAEGTTCPYVSEKGCTVYPVRPFTCRLYGTSPGYRCKMGVSPLQPLNEDEEADLYNLYRENFF